MVIWGAHVVTSVALSPWGTAGFIFSMGVSSGVMGINVSHELQHRINLKLEPFLARIMLWTVLYMHWAIEHVAGHHKNVATPEDPATARYGEMFYAFWFRTVFGGMADAWNIEAARLKRKGIKVFSLRNRVSPMPFQSWCLLVHSMWCLESKRSVIFIIYPINHCSLLRCWKSSTMWSTMVS